MQLRVHEFLPPGLEMPTKTFEHFLGHFFHRYLAMEGWQMEIWLTEDSPTTDQVEHNNHFTCRVILTRPDQANLRAKKKNTNLTAAIYYSLKELHRDLLKKIESAPIDINTNIQNAR